MKIWKQAFTLIELLVVMIIIGVLAAVAIPMLQGNVRRAIQTEAITALGTIRTAERLYYAEFGVYYTIVMSSSGPGNFPAIGINNPDLDGTYFSNKSYCVIPYAGRMSAGCFFAESRAPSPRASEVNTWTNPGRIWMDLNNGVIFYQ